MTELKEKAHAGTFYFADFETVQQNDVHYITSFSIVDAKQILVASGSIDYVDDELIEQSLKLIERFVEICFAIPSKNNIFYFHNFIKYDMFFLLNGITRNPEMQIEILSRDKIFYSVSIKYKTKEEISFRDSMLMISMSLQNLSDVYCVVNKKKMFDHINSYSDYSEPAFIKQLEMYCISDSKCLSEGFLRFRGDIKKHFKIDSFNCLTASSLALRIFRTCYYDSKKTPIFSAGENKDAFIRKSYYGGVVELYKPKMGAGFHYDLNALYPSIMKDNEFPIGEGKFVRGSEINLDNFYGFVEVDVFSPYNNKPFLVMRDKRGLVAGVGSWSGVYHSEEILYAKKLGYQFELKGGYRFEKAKIFERFVTDLYALRVACGKSSALGKSLKNIMNAIYGKFGMRLESTKTNIVTHSEFQKINKI
ncbi:DNA polymerase, partial [Flavobacterium sp.]|uniref:DNA polymerase n=1 Tax=Flavobacterium sp. TaxID=239 RepID=UPI00374CA08E